MLTPNLDKLAAEGLVFDNAYTQFAYCAPSRNSFMTGRRPERTKCLNFLTDFRKQHGDGWVSMPEFFKNAGYFTTAAGKLYHDGMDDPLSWSFPSNQTTWIQCVPGDDADVNKNYCGVTNASRIQYTDEELALKEGLRRMQAGHDSGQPWWVGIGIHRPHWPSRLPAGWTGPEVYPTGVLPPDFPKGIPLAPYMSGAYRDGDYKNSGLGCPNCSAPTADTIEYRRWYFAAVSYADHMLGQALNMLDTLGERDTTIVVFHSDHGYQLGELNEWSKKTTTELATRVPLMIRAPMLPQSAGTRTAVRAELVDLYRTLVDLAGLNSSAIQPDVQGVSLAPLLTAPGAPPPAPLAGKIAYSQIGSCKCQKYNVSTPGLNWTGMECNAGRCVNTNVTDFDFMGYSMNTPAEINGGTNWRYTVWVPMDNATARVDWTKEVFHELYNQTSDVWLPGTKNFDSPTYAINVAADHPGVCAQFRTHMQAEVTSWY